MKNARSEKRWFVEYQDRAPLFQSNERAGAYCLMGRYDFDAPGHAPATVYKIADFGHNKDFAIRCAELFNELGSSLRPEHNYLSERRKIEARERSIDQGGLLNVTR